MARGLGSTITNILAQDKLLYSDLIEMYLDSTERHTNAPFSMTTTTPTGGSGTYSANGEFLSFDSISETADARVNQINVVFSAASDTFTNLFLNNDYMNARIVIYRLFYDDSFAQIGSPVMLWDGEIVGYKINERSDTSNISIQSSSVFYDFERSNGRRTNDVSQQNVFSGDKGMEYSTSSVGDIAWGKPF